ncbi:hypothetical protein C8F04DRAFT_1172690 [Mycena alexandri]|uniref:Uncharacterized protein n=1 Tax=Mycena alexandri TaxID=1745969 RepID=A0AAD6TIG4_9AGAR|nr:hypothetical protein C8F04DRAFT_1172688 [Mycena alexandri]KAJ7046876.1 hypothetical protein C8F04DRAFT_1172690 [Mycena alexandri]
MGYYWNTEKRQLSSISEDETTEEEATATINEMEEYNIDSEEEIEVESENDKEEEDWEDPEDLEDSQIEDSEEDDETGYNTFQVWTEPPIRSRTNGAYNEKSSKSSF